MPHYACIIQAGQAPDQQQQAEPNDARNAPIPPAPPALIRGQGHPPPGARPGSGLEVAHADIDANPVAALLSTTRDGASGL